MDYHSVEKLGAQFVACTTRLECEEALHAWATAYTSKPSFWILGILSLAWIAFSLESGSRSFRDRFHGVQLKEQPTVLLRPIGPRLTSRLVPIITTRRRRNFALLAYIFGGIILFQSYIWLMETFFRRGMRYIILWRSLEPAETSYWADVGYIISILAMLAGILFSFLLFMLNVTVNGISITELSRYHPVSEKAQPQWFTWATAVGTRAIWELEVVPPRQTDKTDVVSPLQAVKILGLQGDKGELEE